MKRIIVLAAVLAIAAVKATASSSPFAVFNLSGTAVFNKTNYSTSTADIATTVTKSLNNKFVYNLISNAVAAATNGLADNLPTNGYIAYNLIDPHSSTVVSDGNVNGYFFVTNKAGFYYQLSGYDTNHNYYSFMELDSSLYPISSSLGFGNLYGNDTNINYAYSYNLNRSTGAGSLKLTQTAQLCIHSNPYYYDYMDDLYEFYADYQDAIVISGTLVLSGSESGGSVSVTGAGSVNINNGIDQGVITSGKATLH